MAVLRSQIRRQIQRFPQVATYPTSWAGALTFQQLYDDLAHYVTNVMKSKNIHRTNYLPDCLQHGFMALWLELAENQDFLAQKTRQQAVFFILARCKISTLRYYDDKYDSLEALMSYDWRSSWDEHTITGFSAPSGWWNSVEPWATWATDIDIRLDVERIVRKLAEKYADSFKHLVALYAVTTQVTRKDAAALAGVAPRNWHKTYAEPMRQEVRYEFAQAFLERHRYTLPEQKLTKNRNNGQFISPYRNWREQYLSGETLPATQVLKQYQDTPVLSKALQAQIDGLSYQQAAHTYQRSANTFRKHLKRAARLLAAAYA